MTVEPQWIEPGETFEAALRDSARIIEANGKRIGYVRVWSYAGNEYQQQLEEVLSDGKLKDADALIWDLRDGWGGAHPRYLSVFNTYGPTLALTGRNGSTNLVGYRWGKPVAMLVNGGTRSGKEVLAYGFKKNGFGQVIGERTAGALLAGHGVPVVGRQPADHGRRGRCRRWRARRGRRRCPLGRGAVRSALCRRQGSAARQGDRRSRRRRVIALG